MSAFSELVTENPMLVEIRRVRARMLSTRSGGANIAAIVLIIAFYSVILLFLLRAANEIDPVWIIVTQTGIVSLLLPVSAASAIAGERENRTWDILIVTPITKAQIVAGKFIASVSMLAIFYGAFLIPVVVCLAVNHDVHLRNSLLAELVSVCFGLLLIAYSMLVSSRSRTTFAAIGACVGVVFLVLLVVPVFVSVLSHDLGNDFLAITHPIMVIAWLANRTEGPVNHIWVPTLLNSAIYLVVAYMFLAAATTSVRKMEEIKNVMPEREGKRSKAGA